MARSIETWSRLFIWVSLRLRTDFRPRILPSARAAAFPGSELDRPSSPRGLVDGRHHLEVPEAFLAGSEGLGVVDHALGEGVHLRREVVAHGLAPLLHRPPAQD